VPTLLTMSFSSLTRTNPTLMQRLSSTWKSITPK
jgi:hypothetical protein